MYFFIAIIIFFKYSFSVFRHGSFGCPCVEEGYPEEEKSWCGSCHWRVVRGLGHDHPRAWSYPIRHSGGCSFGCFKTFPVIQGRGFFLRPLYGLIGPKDMINSSVHHPFARSRHVFNTCNRIQLATLASPLAWWWPTKVKHWFTPKSWQNLTSLWSLNCWLLTVVSNDGPR